MPNLKRSLLKALLALALVVGLVMPPLWKLLPPEPRITIPGKKSAWLSPDGSRVVTSGSPWLWDAHTGSPLASLREDWQLANSWPVFSPDRHLVVLNVGSKRIVFGDLRNGETWITALPASWQIQRFLFSPDGRILAAEDECAEIVAIEAANGRILDRWGLPGKSVSAAWEFTPDGDLLAYTSFDKESTRVSLWDTRTHRCHVLPDSATVFLAISPDGKTLLTIQKPDGDAKAGLALWEADLSRKTPRACLPIKVNANQPVSSAFTADSTKLAIWNSPHSGDPSVVEFWNVQTGQRIAETTEFEDIYGGVWTPDGSQFAVSSVFCTRSLVGNRKRVTGEFVKVSLHDATTGRLAWEQTWPRDAFNTFPTFSPSGQSLAVYGPNCVQFLDPATGQMRSVARLPEAHVSTATNLEFTPDKRRLFYREIGSVGVKPNLLDRTLAWLNLRGLTAEQREWDLVTVYDMETERELVRLEYAKHLEANLSEDGQTLVTTHEDHIAVWDVPGWPPLRGVLGVPLGLWAAICLYLERGRFRSVAKVSSHAPR